MIHLALDLAHVAFVDSNRKYVAADFGSLVAVYRLKKWVFSGALGDKLTRVTTVAAPRVDGSGFAWSGGVRFDASASAHIMLSIGAEPGASLITGTYSSSVQHFLRIETVIDLL